MLQSFLMKPNCIAIILYMKFKRTVNLEDANSLGFSFSFFFSFLFQNSTIHLYFSLHFAFDSHVSATILVSDKFSFWLAIEVFLSS